MIIIYKSMTKESFKNFFLRVVSVHVNFIFIKILKSRKTGVDYYPFIIITQLILGLYILFFFNFMLESG